MSNYVFEKINLDSKIWKNKIENFLEKFKLKYTDVDLTIVVTENNSIVAVCSKKNNLIKNIAIDEKHWGENISNTLITMVMKEIFQQGYDSAMVVTKVENKKIFASLNFKLIYQNERISFLSSNDKDYLSYKEMIQNLDYKNKTAFIILNANPFTLGHEHLVETASKENDIVYLIPVLEDISFFSTDERTEIILKNITKFSNVELLKGTQYLISNNLFPSYFLKSTEESIKEQSQLDANIFCDLIGKNFSKVTRYVGEEPYSKTTEIYNNIIKEELNQRNIKLKIIKRLEKNNVAVSASIVRECIFKNDLETIKKMVSKETFEIISQEKYYKRALENPNKIFKNN
ncbi:[citrate (pro-3S)-lyase] ligase [Spiroplasma chinense]|uniref:[citrate (Pro-3S)-lyase] ligase n=1 Tax=Spiroplasma chinense TaxID=216932 RepID=A0A5B9Y437_9MOLU|nr:hypothetical protein [Spiroplasma chinense]QEH61436.1 [citrate (pro-3S)-lyase] ligase [Spiroplasma chinense]